MAAPVFPSVPNAIGNVKVLFTPTVTDPTAPSLTTDIGATGALDLSCFLQQWQPTAEPNKGSPPARLCTTRQFESFGLTTESIADLTYVVDPQAATGDDGKLAYEALLEGTEGFFIERLGKDAQTEFAEGDFVRAIPITCGPQTPSGDTSEEFAEFIITQAVTVRAPGFGKLVAVAA